MITTTRMKVPMHVRQPSVPKHVRQPSASLSSRPRGKSAAIYLVFFKAACEKCLVFFTVYMRELQLCVRTGQDKTGQDRTGQDRAEHDWTGRDRTGQDRTG